MTHGFHFWYRYLLYCLQRAMLSWMTPATSGAGVGLLTDTVRSRTELIVENAFLRQQVLVLRRTVKRPLPTARDRFLMVVLASKVRAWKQALLIVQPETLLRWHRDLFRWVWRRKSKATTCQPRLPLETITLIVQMIRENWLWGAERIRGELLKLGIRVSKRTIQRYMRRIRRPRPRGQTWATFLHNHAQGIWACDFVQIDDLFFRTLFVFVIIEHASRRVIHLGVTRSPSDRWVAQQLKDATAFGIAPRYLLHDNDSKYGARFSFIAASTGIQQLRIPPHSPNLNAICERFIGSLRRECLDHIFVFTERKLQQVLKGNVLYFNQARPHQGIHQQLPDPEHLLRTVPSTSSKVIAQPILGGLHHAYRRAA